MIRNFAYLPVSPARADLDEIKKCVLLSGICTSAATARRVGVKSMGVFPMRLRLGVLRRLLGPADRCPLSAEAIRYSLVNVSACVWPSHTAIATQVTLSTIGSTAIAHRKPQESAIDRTIVAPMGVPPSPRISGAQRIASA